MNREQAEETTHISRQAELLAYSDPSRADETQALLDLAEKSRAAVAHRIRHERTMGVVAAMDVATTSGQDVVIGAPNVPAVPGWIGVLALGHDDNGATLHAYETELAGQPSSGRMTAKRQRVEHGTAAYLKELLVGAHADPRVDQMIHQWLADPKRAELIAQLREQGLPVVTYQRVAIGTDGTVTVAALSLSTPVTVRLTGATLELAS